LLRKLQLLLSLKAVSLSGLVANSALSVVNSTNPDKVVAARAKAKARVERVERALLLPPVSPEALLLVLPLLLPLEEPLIPLLPLEEPLMPLLPPEELLMPLLPLPLPLPLPILLPLPVLPTQLPTILISRTR
jgi:hypothetical protein